VQAKKEKSGSKPPGKSGTIGKKFTRSATEVKRDRTLQTQLARKRKDLGDEYANFETNNNQEAKTT